MKIFITGTSTPTGIGQSLVRHLGAQGHQFWGLARTAHEDFVRECDRNQTSFRFSVCDITQWDQVDSLSRQVRDAWGSLDALICCAGVQGPIRNAMEADPIQWARNIATNLTGTYYCIRALYPLLCQAERRAKVICLSGGGSTGPRLNFTPYASSKTGLLRLVEILSLEWQNQPFDINAIAPGAVNTRMTQEVLELGPDKVGAKEFATASKQWKEGGTPVEKYGPLVGFLLSERSDGISGRLLSALWDPWDTLAQHKEKIQRSDIYTLRRILPEDRG